MPKDRRAKSFTSHCEQVNKKVKNRTTKTNKCYLWLKIFFSFDHCIVCPSIYVVRLYSWYRINNYYSIVCEYSHYWWFINSIGRVLKFKYLQIINTIKTSPYLTYLYINQGNICVYKVSILLFTFILYDKHIFFV